nr:MAG TPA: hypothetical protein [Caudoviricetes sp.]
MIFRIVFHFSQSTYNSLFIIYLRSTTKFPY